MEKKFPQILAVVLVLLAVFLALNRKLESRGDDGGAFADFSLQLIETSGGTEYFPMSKKTVSLRDLPGQFILLNFWASWCGACESEETDLAYLARKFSPEKLTVLGIATNDTMSAVRDSGKDERRPFLLALDPDGDVAARHDIDHIPRSLLLGPQRRVLMRFSQPLTSRHVRRISKKIRSLNSK